MHLTDKDKKVDFTEVLLKPDISIPKHYVEKCEIQLYKKLFRQINSYLPSCCLVKR